MGICEDLCSNMLNSTFHGLGQAFGYLPPRKIWTSDLDPDSAKSDRRLQQDMSQAAHVAIKARTYYNIHGHIKS